MNPRNFGVTYDVKFLKSRPDHKKTIHGLSTYSLKTTFFRFNPARLWDQRATDYYYCRK